MLKCLRMWICNDRDTETTIIPLKSNTGSDQDQAHFGNPLHVPKNLTFTLIWSCDLWEPTSLKHHGENQVTCCLGKFSDTWTLITSLMPLRSTNLTPKQCQFSIITANSKIFIKTQQCERLSPLTVCHLSTYHPAWLMSEIETIKSNRGVWPKPLKCVKTDFTLSLKHLIFVRSRNRI